MIQPLPQPITFDEFIAWYPQNSEHRYELHDGVIVEMPKPIGNHSKVAGYLNGILFMEIVRANLPYFIPKECVVNSSEYQVKLFRGEQSIESNVFPDLRLSMSQILAAVNVPMGN